MFRCEMCGAVFDLPLVLNHLDPRPDCFMERFREVQCPYCNGPYFNEFEEDKQMIVNVKYRDSLTGEYFGRSYSYFCDIPDVQTGDIVIAPTFKGDTEAQIVEVDVPESKVDERVLPLLKTITRRKEDADDGE